MVRSDKFSAIVPLKFSNAFKRLFDFRLSLVDSQSCFIFAKRDLSFNRINQIHKARGMPRQGQGFSVGRLANLELKKKAGALNAQARKRGLKSKARFIYISEHLGLRDTGDYRQLRKLLELTPNRNMIFRSINKG